MSFWHNLGQDIVHVRAVQVAAGAAVAGAVAAWYAAINAARTLKSARKDSLNRSRPYVTAELRTREYSDTTAILVVRNYGQSEARNLRVTFDPPIPDPPAAEASSSTIPYLKRRYAKAITLTPGQELDSVYAFATPQQFPQPPDLVTAHLSYEGPSGESYTSVFDLDMEVIRTGTFVRSSTDPAVLMQKAVEYLKTVADSVKGELEVITETRNEYAARQEASRQQREKQVAEWEERRTARRAAEAQAIGDQAQAGHEASITDRPPNPESQHD